MNLDSNLKISVIGVGIMGETILKCLLDSGVSKSQLSFYEKNSERAATIKSTYAIEEKKLSIIGSESAVIFIAVKPQDVEHLLKEISGDLAATAVLISIAAGKTTRFIESNTVNANPVIRVMPNTPAIFGFGAAAICKGINATQKDLEIAKELLAKTGLLIEVDESQMDAVTALSGSGPAYFFLLVESMIKAGVKLGLTEDQAKQLTNQTILGAAKMLSESGFDAQTLRANVTSPNGTTAAAIKIFQDSGFEKLVEEAMRAAKHRASELA